MKLSIVVICWNDADVIANCLRSIFEQTKSTEFEVIVTDNGSTDGSLAQIRRLYPQVRIVENCENLGFGEGNNAGIRVAQGEYVLILNPDTIVHERALDHFVAFADRHPEAGAFGCRTLNPDGSFQHTAQCAPTIFRYLIGALSLRFLGRLSESFCSDEYTGWQGRSERQIGFQAGCSLLARRRLLEQLGGFDRRFFHQFEDADLCHRIWKLGHAVLFCPYATITHIGGQNRNRYPINVLLETYRSRYRYFHKHYGNKGAVRIRWVSLVDLARRYAGWNLLRLLGRKDAPTRVHAFRVLFNWNRRLKPLRFIETSEEPDMGYKPLSAASGRNGKTLGSEKRPQSVS